MNTILEPSLPVDFQKVASWITSAEDCRLRAGPMVQFPFNSPDLEKILYIKDSVFLSYCGSDSQLLGFGQIWPRSDSYAHLGRIIVDPTCRGNGLGRILVQALIQEAINRLSFRTVTLKVYRKNLRALTLYESIGFIEDPSESTEESALMKLEID